MNKTKNIFKITWLFLLVPVFFAFAGCGTDLRAELKKEANFQSDIVYNQDCEVSEVKSVLFDVVSNSFFDGDVTPQMASFKVFNSFKVSVNQNGSTTNSVVNQKEIAIFKKQSEDIFGYIYYKDGYVFEDMFAGTKQSTGKVKTTFATALTQTGVQKVIEVAKTMYQSAGSILSSKDSTSSCFKFCLNDSEGIKTLLMQYENELLSAVHLEIGSGMSRSTFTINQFNGTINIPDCSRFKEIQN